MTRSDPGSDPGSPRPAHHGRGRSRKLDEAISGAAIRLLGEQGPARFSLEAVAAEVGCAKSSIYRRYGSRAGLLAEVGRTLFDPGPEIPERNFTEHVVDRLADSMARPGAVLVLMALLGAAAARTPVGDEIMRAVFNPIRRRRVELLSRAVQAGELRDGVDLDLFLDILSGTIAFRSAIRGETEADLADRLVELLLQGIAPPARS